jgi:hypothetical protein
MRLIAAEQGIDGKSWSAHCSLLDSGAGYGLTLLILNRVNATISIDRVKQF